MRIHSTVRRFGTFIALGSIVIALSVALTMVASSFFVLRTIEVVGDGVRIAVDTKRLEKNLLFFPSEKYKKEILASNPELESLSITKRLPSTLVLSTKLRSPFVVLDSHGQRMNVSRDGIVLSAAQGSHGPFTISIDMGNLAVGQKILDPRVNQAIAFTSQTQSFLPSVQIHILDESSLLAKTPESDILFPQKGDLSGRTTTLQTIVAGFRIKGQMPTYIDLRFDKPVIRI